MHRGRSRRYTLKVNAPGDIACRRCGTCCLADMIAYVTQADMERWAAEGRDDILKIIENERAFWAGDHLVSAKDGRVLTCCPFLTWDSEGALCSIYGTRPHACRNYRPGSSEICPLWKAPGHNDGTGNIDEKG